VRIIATIEARMTSSRLPGKVLLQSAGKPMLAHMIERLRRVPSLSGIVVATTVNQADDPIVALANQLGVGVWRGSEDDVLARVLDAAQAYQADVIVETTGDCPLLDPEIVEACIDEWRSAKVDYVSNVLKRTYPIGMDTQVFKTDVLADVAKRTSDPVDHEHVSLYIYRHPKLYSLKNVAAPPELTDPDLRLTLDTKDDYLVIDSVFDALYRNKPGFCLADILEFLDRRPQLRELNRNVVHRWV
jgi:spore coat polysaccharide biosynthesis protein SpsF